MKVNRNTEDCGREMDDRQAFDLINRYAECIGNIRHTHAYKCRQTDTQTDRQKQQTDRQTDRHSDRNNRQTDRLTDKYTD